MLFRSRSSQLWNISTARTHIPETGMGTVPKPFQRPHPPIVVTAVAPFSQGIAEAAARGWDAISANFLLPKWVRSHWIKYEEGCQRVGRVADLEGDRTMFKEDLEEANKQLAAQKAWVNR